MQGEGLSPGKIYRMNSIAIVGFGVIGRGVARALLEKKNLLRDVRVEAICEIDGSLINERGIDLKSALSYAEKGKLEKHRDWSSKKALDVLGEIDLDLMLELTPGDIKSGEPGLSHIREALKRGVNVVTSNKAPLALKFSELMKLAGKRGVQLRYEATVGGAIPIINLYRSTLQANEIRSIYGILNGTSNFILTKMTEELVAMEVALKEAQELGIAEANPEYDIKGIDTGAKVAILANSLMGKRVSFKDIKVKGIEEVTLEAVELAKKDGYRIKLIGDVSSLEVSPRLVEVTHPLNVSGSLNAVMLKTDLAGEITVIGYGAGSKETSSSVLSDVMEVLR